MNKLKKWGLVMGLSALCACSINHFKKENQCRNIKIDKNTSEIEQIIDKDATATAEEVFTDITGNFTFYTGHDEEIFGCKDKMSSMQETYYLGTGDCEDGAVLFKMKMSKNSRYLVEMIWLVAKKDVFKENKNHSMDVVYDKYEKFWSYVSFNENYQCPEKFVTIEEAINHFNKKNNKIYAKYYIMDRFTDEELKFSQHLDKHRGRSLNWIDLE